MPGFCGIIARDGGDYTKSLERMINALSHRGGLKKSKWQKEGVFFGLIDHEIEECEEGIILFDGYVRPPCPPDLDNHPIPFAFAHFKEGVLTLARDPIGAKPLYWTEQNGLFLFASELKSLISSQLFILRPDLESLSFYLSLGYFPLNKTPFKNVSKVLPGHKLILTREREIINRATFSLSDLLRQNNPKWNAEEFEAIAREEIEKINAEKAATIAFEKGDIPESLRSLPSLEIEPMAFEEITHELPKIIWYLDEPLSSGKILSFWRLCQKAKDQNITDLILTTGSLPWLSRHIHRPHILAPGFQRIFRRSLHSLLLTPPLTYLKTEGYYSLLRMLNTHSWHTKFLRNQYTLPDSLLTKLTGGRISPIDPEIIYHSFPPFEKLAERYASLYYLHQKTSLIHKYLPQYDRLPEAFGINVHLPYLHRTPIAYFASMPEEKMAELFKRRSIPKQKKPLFARTTLVDSFKTSKLFSLLEKGVMVDNGLLDPKALRRLLRHNIKRPPYLRVLWDLLIFEVWLRLFFESSVSLSPPEVNLQELLRSS